MFVNIHLIRPHIFGMCSTRYGNWDVYKLRSKWKMDRLLRHNWNGLHNHNDVNYNASSSWTASNFEISISTAKQWFSLFKWATEHVSWLDSFQEVFSSLAQSFGELDTHKIDGNFDFNWKSSICMNFFEMKISLSNTVHGNGERKMATLGFESHHIFSQNRLLSTQLINMLLFIQTSNRWVHFKLEWYFSFHIYHLHQFISNDN